ncbi:hypothetical protein HZ994_02885 [Akkermansiaceae bacterium]|nr:hypothetical protein HZ994_02885 [Akkermansiaceae bacterium]
MKRIIPTHLLLAASLLAAETRTWTNPDGTKSFEAEFVSRGKDTVSLLRSDGRKLEIKLTLLHHEDQRWVNANHPADGGDPVPDPDAVFDTLKFGDSRDSVTEKLKASKMVETAVAGTFFGRTGLNGIFRTRHEIGGLFCYLFFDWDEGGGLKEITLQTEGKPAAQYDSTLKPCWAQLVELIGPIHGKALQDAGFPASTKLAEGQMLASHLWNIESGGSVMLGTSRVGDEYQVSVRFTREKIPVNRTP